VIAPPITREAVTGTALPVDGGWTCYSPTPGFEFVEREGRIGT